MTIHEKIEIAKKKWKREYSQEQNSIYNLLQ